MTAPALGDLPDAPLGVAVSGGGDSVALLMLLHHAGHDIHAATVNHQLRPEAAHEAAQVATLCAQYKIPHATLVWETPERRGNIQNEARLARWKLLADWAQKTGLRDIVLGHTLDDQAETVLMRLARGSGVDGISGMAARRCQDGVCWHRPLLEIRRADLRNYLQTIGIGWTEDPSNENLKYDRIKARKALEILAPLGLDSARLSQTANHMRRARGALEFATKDLALDCTTISDAGEVRINRATLALAPREIQLRLISSALGWVASAPYRPRFIALGNLLDACLSNEQIDKTLHGCLVAVKNDEIVINREVAATRPSTGAATIWDGRWEISHVNVAGQEIKALGEQGLKLCPDWRNTGKSRVSLLASPSLWQKELLIAAPMANFGDNWVVNLAGGKKGFYDLLVTH